MTSDIKEKKYKNHQKTKDNVISVVIGFFALAWLFPIAWTIWSSLRPYNDVISNGVFSFPKHLNLDNYINAVRLMKLPMYLTNSFLITALCLNYTILNLMYPFKVWPRQLIKVKASWARRKATWSSTKPLITSLTLVIVKVR